jgi:hypothetical protein
VGERATGWQPVATIRGRVMEQWHYDPTADLDLSPLERLGEFLRGPA